MESTACPVCTLYLREGISLYDHLDTHPKDQVIEALIRIRERDDSTAPSQQLISIPTSQSAPFYPTPQPCYPVHQYSANSYAYQQMAIMGSSSIPPHMGPVAMVMPPNAPNPSLMQVMYNPYLLQQQNIHLLAPQSSPSQPSSPIHTESPLTIPKVSISSHLTSESVQTNLSSDSTPFHLHSPTLEPRKRQSPTISHSGFVPPLPAPTQPIRPVPVFEVNREEARDEDMEVPLSVKLSLHSEESPASPRVSSPSVEEYPPADSNRSSCSNFVQFQLARLRSSRLSQDSAEVFVTPSSTDKETSTPTPWPAAANVDAAAAATSGCPANISSGLRELIANNTIKLTPVPTLAAPPSADAADPAPSISLTLRSKRSARAAAARKRSASDSCPRAPSSPPRAAADPPPFFLGLTGSSRHEPAPAPHDADTEEVDEFRSDLSQTSRRNSLKTDPSDDDAESKRDVDLLLEPARAEAAVASFRRVSLEHDGEDPLEVRSAVDSIVIQMGPARGGNGASREEYITADCSFGGRRAEEDEEAGDPFEARFLGECLGGFDATATAAVPVAAFNEHSQGSEREYLTLATAQPAMQPKVLKQQIDDLNVSTSYEVLAREGWAVLDGSDTESATLRRCRRREPSPEEPRWQEVRLGSPPPSAAAASARLLREPSPDEPRWQEVQLCLPPAPAPDAAKARAPRPYKCALCGETFNCPKERRVHRTAFHSAKAKLPAEAAVAADEEADGAAAAATAPLKTEKKPARPRRKKRVVKACSVLVVQSASDKFTGVFVKEDGIEPMEPKEEAEGIKTEERREGEAEEPAAATAAGGSVIRRAPRKVFRQARGGPYTCVSCPSTFVARNKLLQHVRLEHKNLRLKNPYICNVCQEVFTNDRRYSEHLKVHPLECKTCCKTFFRRQNLVLHMRRHLGIKPYPCNMCAKSFITKQKLTEHKNVHLNLTPIKCSLCTMSFRRYSNLIQHKNRFHYLIKKKVKDYVCFCGEIYHSRKKLDWHKEIHEKKPKCCKFCSERFVHTASLTRHVRRAHDRRYMPKVGRETENVECSVCGHVFLKSSLSVHMRLHTGERPYSCTVCGKSFTTKWNLQQHRWTHMSRSSKPFKCSQCKSAFARESDYTQHMDSHSNKRPYTCNVCGLQFVRKNNCIRHAKEHQAVKTFTCKVCSKSFHRGYYLKDHMMVHSGARPFTCHICGKASSTKSNHNKHVKIHHAREPVNTEA